MNAISEYDTCPHCGAELYFHEDIGLFCLDCGWAAKITLTEILPVESWPPSWEPFEVWLPPLFMVGTFSFN